MRTSWTRRLVATSVAGACAAAWPARAGTSRFCTRAQADPGAPADGAFARDTRALARSVDLSDRGVTSPDLRRVVLRPTLCVRDGADAHYFLIAPAIADGVRTVGDLLDLADRALRDPSAFGPGAPITRKMIAEAVQSVNLAFEGCRAVC